MGQRPGSGVRYQLLSSIPHIHILKVGANSNKLSPNVNTHMFGMHITKNEQINNK